MAMNPTNFANKSFPSESILDSHCDELVAALLDSLVTSLASITPTAETSQNSLSLAPLLMPIADEHHDSCSVETTDTTNNNSPLGSSSAASEPSSDSASMSIKIEEDLKKSLLNSAPTPLQTGNEILVDSSAERSLVSTSATFRTENEAAVDPPGESFLNSSSSQVKTENETLDTRGESIPVPTLKQDQQQQPQNQQSQQTEHQQLQQQQQHQQLQQQQQQQQQQQEQQGQQRPAQRRDGQLFEVEVPKEEGSIGLCLAGGRGADAAFKGIESFVFLVLV